MHARGGGHRLPDAGASARRVVLVVGVAAWLVVQIGLPAVRLVERGGGERPRTAGWQMFSHDIDGPPEQFTVITDEGRVPVQLAPLLTGPARREVVVAPQVIDALCERPRARAIEVVDVEHGTTTATC